MNFDLDFYKGKKVFVTGHTGFKGSWLCKMLVNAGAIVTGYSLNPPTSPSLYEIAGIEQDVHSVIGDIRDFKTLKAAFDEAQPEIVLHLAAQPIVRDSYKNPAYTYETNVMGTVNILECVRNSSCVKSFLNVTTDKVYLNKEWAWGYRENEELDGYDPYSNSKSCSELVTHSYKNSFFNDDHVAISTARAGNVIGGGDFANDRIIPDCIRAAIKHEDIVVRNPFSTRPYQHVLEPLYAYNHISDINKNKLIEVVKEYRRDISFVPMPDMKELTGQEIDTRRWNISTFGRLYMASALPETVHKVLNIDCDTIIVDTIEPLWNTDMTGKVFGGMLECINDRYRRNVGKNDGDYYLNGGIVFLNLDEVRVGNYERKFTDYITKYGSSLAYLDQDVLNGVVEQEKKVKLPMRYNTLSIYFYATYEQVLKIRRSKSQDFYSKEEFSEAISNPGLVHFTTCFLDGLRPWIKGNQHPYLKTFLKYKEMSPWRDIPLQEDKRSGLVKFRTTMIRKAPRFVLCEVASVLHGVIIPEKNYKRMQERVKE